MMREGEYGVLFVNNGSAASEITCKYLGIALVESSVPHVCRVFNGLPLSRNTHVAGLLLLNLISISVIKKPVTYYIYICIW